MAQSIKVVSKSVNGVSIAVTAMEAAVIAAEIEASKHVCDKLDNGFFLLIRSQISQKVAHLHSSTIAKLMTLRQLTIALESIRRQMERDYHMISLRYKKLFYSLDKSLQQRVFELDKMPANIATNQYPNLIGRLRNNGSGFLINQNEIIPLSQFTASAKFKTDTDYLIGSIRDNLKEQTIMNSKLKYSLCKEKINSQKTVSIPILITEADGLGGMGKLNSIHSPSFDGNLFAAEKKVKLYVAETVKNWIWKESNTNEKNKVMSELKNLCAKSTVDPRVQTELMRLANASTWQSPSEKGI